MQNWKNCNYLASHIAKPLTVFNNTDKTFIYYEAPYVNIYGIDHPMPYQKTNMNMKDFCYAVSNTNDKNYYYIIGKEISVNFLTPKQTSINTQ
jgi:hypothetical protein